MYVCAGQLPSALTSANFAAHVFGCSVAEDGLARVIVTVRHRLAKWHILSPWPLLAQDGPNTSKPGPWGLEHSIGARVTAPAFELGSTRCMASFGSGAVVLECQLAPAELAAARHVDVSMVDDSTTARLTLALGRSPLIPGKNVHCATVPVFGDLQALQLRLNALQKAWRQNSFPETLLFARDSSTCAALTSARKGVACEVRSPSFGSIVRRETGQFGTFTRYSFSDNRTYSDSTDERLEQSILSSLCLAYSQTAGAPWLALTDLDETPLPGLFRALARLRERGPDTFAGARVFFDAEHTCPSGWCPSSESEYQSGCRKGLPAGVQHKRRAFKPIVVPARVSDISVHRFTSLRSGYTSRNLFQPCLQHELGGPSTAQPNRTRGLPSAQSSRGQNHSKKAAAGSSCSWPSPHGLVLVAAANILPLSLLKSAARYGVPVALVGIGTSGRDWRLEDMHGLKWATLPGVIEHEALAQQHIIGARSAGQPEPLVSRGRRAGHGRERATCVSATQRARPHIGWPPCGRFWH